jgi:hypothetical protein
MNESMNRESIRATARQVPPLIEEVPVTPLVQVTAT